jgi:DNA-binding transcriptional LysR family regulator
LPPILGDFVRNYPMVRIQVNASRSAELIERVTSGHLDLALAWGDPGDRAHGRRIASVPTGRILPKMKSVPVDRDGALPLVAFDEPCIFRRLAVMALDANDVRWRVSFESPSLPGLWAAVDAGLGITMRTAISLPAKLKFVEPGQAGLPSLPAVPLSLYQSSPQLSAAVALLADLITINLATIPVA